MPNYAGQPSSFYASTNGVPKEGAWYGSQQYVNGQLTTPKVSAEVNAQSAAAQGKSVQEFNSFLASDIKAPVSVPYSSGATSQYVGSISGDVDKSRQALQDTLNQQKAVNDAKLTELKKTEADTVAKVGDLTTPFREDLQKTQNESLYINKNFEDNQKLVDELDGLLTQGNALIQQQKDVTGLAAVRNPRIQKTMDDVAARAGVIQAVMSARNGQIAQAQNMIDRSISAITADRQDRLTYYQTVLSLTNRDILSIDASQKSIAQEEVNTAQKFLDNSLQTSNYFKQLLINPATASLMGDAGVRLTDSPEQVSQKLSEASYSKSVIDMTNQMSLSGANPVFDPSTVPANQLVSVTDSKGQIHYFQKPQKAATQVQTVSSFLDNFTKQGKTASKIQKPPTGPYALGAIYTDENGRIWKYTNSGWQLL
jgi:hypothetical protein